MKDTLHIKIGLYLILGALVWAGCDTVEPATDEPVAPEVLPEEAFSMNLNFFDQDQPAGKSGAAPSHYLAAVLRVSVATVITGSILYHPAVLTAAVQQVDPVFSDGAYVWAADTLIDGRVHGVVLEARVNGEEVLWEMEVSGIDDETGTYLEDFLLYEAQTGILTEEGTFQIYFPIEGISQQVMDGSYSVTADDIHTLIFTIPRGVEDVGGSSAVYEHNGNRITIDLTGPEGSRHLVEWDTETNEGSLTADDYNNGEQACWNASKVNVACPAS